MKRIPLTHGKFAIVDDSDFKPLSEFKWYAAWSDYTKSYRAQRTSTPDENGKRKTILMHRHIVGNPPGIPVDHENHDTLDNQRGNLRACTYSNNNANLKGCRKSSKSRVRGVYSSGGTGKWLASIQVRGQRIHLGTHSNKQAAADAYVAANKYHFGRFGGL